MLSWLFGFTLGASMSVNIAHGFQILSGIYVGDQQTDL